MYCSLFLLDSQTVSPVNQYNSYWRTSRNHDC